MSVYREGAKDRCYHCARPKSEHGKRLECPRVHHYEWDEARAGRRTPRRKPCP